MAIRANDAFLDRGFLFDDDILSEETVGARDGCALGDAGGVGNFGLVGEGGGCFAFCE